MWPLIQMLWAKYFLTSQFLLINEVGLLRPLSKLSQYLYFSYTLFWTPSSWWLNLRTIIDEELSIEKRKMIHKLFWEALFSCVKCLKILENLFSKNPIHFPFSVPCRKTIRTMPGNILSLNRCHLQVHLTLFMDGPCFTLSLHIMSPPFLENLIGARLLSFPYSLIKPAAQYRIW